MISSPTLPLLSMLQILLHASARVSMSALTGNPWFRHSPNASPAKTASREPARTLSLLSTQPIRRLRRLHSHDKSYARARSNAFIGTYFSTHFSTRASPGFFLEVLGVMETGFLPATHFSARRPLGSSPCAHSGSADDQPAHLFLRPPATRLVGRLQAFQP